MPRKHRRKDDGPKELGPTHAARTIESHPDGDFIVQQITGSSSTKTYRCPGCDQEIRPATPHTVAWPAEDGERGTEHRRHWHTQCWKARDRRGPNQSRSSRGPRY